MKQKLIELFWKDPMLLHKIGFALGAAIGILGGMLVSERADSFVVIEAEEEEDGESED